MAKTDFKDDILNSSMNGKRQYVMVNNPNGTVSLNDVTVYDQMGDDFGAKEANDIGKDINLASYVQIASGTATAITLSNVSLVNGLIITFVVAANNNGAATTINGKALYKPGTTQAPTLTAGKAVTVWYNGTSFFIKASAEGNAVAGDVLAGKTFSNDNDTGVLGGMTDYSGVSLSGGNSSRIETIDFGADGGGSYGSVVFKPSVSGKIDMDTTVRQNVYGAHPDVVKAGHRVGKDGLATGKFTADATAGAGDILATKTAYVNGNKITGSISSKAAQTYTPGTANQTIAAGQYLSGAQTIAGNANLVAANIKQGVSIFGVAGNFTNDATAAAGHMLSGQTAYVKGSKITGNIPSRAAATITPRTTNQTIAAGQYLSGVQTIAGSANLTAANIRSGVNIFGVVGNLTERKFASGTVQSSLDYSYVQHQYGSNETTFRTVYVTGLTFKPSWIKVVYWSQYSTYPEDITVYVANLTGKTYSYNTISGSIGTNTTYQIVTYETSQTMEPYVIYGAFRLPVLYRASAYQWWAGE